MPAGLVAPNVLQLGIAPAVRKAKCTNVQRDAKMQNARALGQTAVSGWHVVNCMSSMD